MRNIYCLALTTGLIISFTGVVWAQASAVSVPNATSESQSTVAVQDDVLLPLIDEPEHHFKMASRDFARGDDAGSAAEIRAGAAFLKLEAGRHDATNKAELEDEADHLDDLAAQVAKGSVKSPKELDNAFASADLALARHYHQMVMASSEHSEHQKTGYWLHGAANSLADSARWSGHKLTQAGTTTVNGARSLGDELEGGAEWTGDKVKQLVSDLGKEIESFGGGGDSRVAASTTSSTSSRQ